MRRIVKHIVKVILIFALIMCFGMSIGYANNIAKDNDTVNFYFENNNYDVSLVKNIEENKSEISVAGWSEKSLQTAVNEELNRTADNLKVLSIRGNSSLLFSGAVLFQDDKDGCLIDSDTSYKLFGSLNSIGKVISYGDRNLTIRGIHNGTKSNIIVQLLDDSDEKLNGLTIDSTNLSRNKIEEFKTRFGIQELDINGGLYHMAAKVFSMILPIIMLVLVLIKVIRSFLNAKNKPILKLIYISMAIIVVYVFFKVTKVSISIPLDMIPNKWSDFDFWIKLWKEYMEKIEYVLYMKKYGIDIYNIQNLISAFVYSVLAVILFVINISVMKIKNIENLLLVLSEIILCTFIAVLNIWSKYSFDINITMVWALYPLYLCAIYFMSVHEKYFIYNEEVVEKDIAENDEDNKESTQLRLIK